MEQQCLYQDCDGLDNCAHHLTAWENGEEQRELVAYLRILAPEKDRVLPAIGRLVTHPNFRRKGLGRELMTRGLSSIEKLYPNSAVCLSAQLYLVDFYQSFGFCVSSDMFEEDGIPHIKMIRHPL